MARNREKSNHYDPWYAKIAFGLFLCVLVGSLVALYSGVPVVQFVTRGLWTQSAGKAFPTTWPTKLFLISITTWAFSSSRSAPRNSCAWVRCHHKTTRMSFATWARTSSMCVLIARRSIATILRCRLTKRARRNVNSVTSSSEQRKARLRLFMWARPVEHSAWIVCSWVSLRFSRIWHQLRPGRQWLGLFPSCARCVLAVKSSREPLCPVALPIQQAPASFPFPGLAPCLVTPYSGRFSLFATSLPVTQTGVLQSGRKVCGATVLHAPFSLCKAEPRPLTL